MSEGTGNDVVDIMQTLNRYTLAIDIADVRTLRERVFSGDARMALLQDASVDEFCDFVTRIMGIIRTQHFLFNTAVDVAGDGADARSYFVGYHHVPAGEQGEECAALFGKHDTAIVSVIGGAYDDRLIRTPRGWRIQSRKVRLIWQQQGGEGEMIAPNWLYR